MKTPIILIGPIGAGKSTLGRLLAARLNLPQRSMDDLRFDYYKEIGYDEALAQQKQDSGGFWALYAYWKPFEAYAVERLLSEDPNCVVDFGAGHSVYEDDTLFARVQKVLAPVQNVILLLPSPDLDESIVLLNAGDEGLRDMNPNINEHFVRHPSNQLLAKFTIYTKGKTAEESCDEVLKLIATS